MQLLKYSTFSTVLIQMNKKYLVTYIFYTDNLRYFNICSCDFNKKLWDADFKGLQQQQ